MSLLQNYTIVQQICENPLWSFAKGIKNSNKAQVLIKTPSSRESPEKHLSRFQNDYDIGSSLKHENILVFNELILTAGNQAIIAEEFEGQSLSSYLKIKRPDLKSFLRISIQLVSALEHIHNKKIIHRDLTPFNILVDPLNQKIKLADFGLCSRFNKEVEYDATPAELVGNLSFISPEQTGRINRPVDYRSDFYSLGITFYYLLTGSLPFDIEEPSKLIHAHIAQFPLTPKQVDESIPEVLSEMTMKLMSKEMESRYQNAVGILADLKICQTQYLNKGSIESFELGKQDGSPRLRLSQKFYGRDDKLEKTLKAIDAFDTSKNHLIFVTGPIGIGKSFFLKEIRRLLTLKKARIISGDYERSSTGIPFLGLIEAIRQGVRFILTESDENLDFWKKQLTSQLGLNLQVIRRYVPELWTIFDDSIFDQQLTHEEIQQRFPFALQEFIKLLCQPSIPLVLILDNLHMADAASFRLLESILTDTTFSGFIFVAAYEQDSELSNHSITDLLDYLEKNHHLVHLAEMENLGVYQVTDFINDSFRCGIEQGFELAEIITAKTDGNPHYIKRFLMQMYWDNHIWFAESEGELKWHFNLGEIKNQDATDNVVDYLVSKFNLLESAEKKVLMTASCLGVDFSRSDLEAILENEDASLEAVLTRLANAKIIDAMDRGLTNQNQTYRFSHVQLQAAAYRNLGKVDRKKLHLKIGRYLFQNRKSPEETDSLIQSVYHLNLGSDLIETPLEQQLLLQLNLEAGNQAKQANIHESAIFYFSKGLELYEQHNIKESQQTKFTLRFGLAESLYMIGEFERLEQILVVLLNSGLTRQQEMLVFGLRIDAFMARNMASEAIDFGLSCFRKIGIVMQRSPGKVKLLVELFKTERTLAGVSFSDLRSLPLIDDPEKNLTIRLIRKILMPAFVADSRLFVLIVLRMMRLTVKWGISVEAMFFSYYGFILCGIRRQFERGYQFGKLGEDLLKQYPKCGNRAAVTHVFDTMVRMWKEPLRNSVQGIWEGYRQAMETGYKEIAVNSLYSQGLAMLYSGDYLGDVYDCIKNNFQTIKRLKHQAAIYIGSLHQQTVENLLEPSEHPCRLKNSDFNEDTIVTWYHENNDNNGLIHYYCEKIFLAFIFGEYEMAVEHALRFKPKMARTIGFISHFLIDYYYALSSLALLSNQTQSVSASKLKEIGRINRLFEYMAEINPSNFLNNFYLVKAEIHRMKQPHKAIKYYNLAIESAGKNGFVHEQAIASERFSEYWRELGDKKISEVYLKEAYSLYHQWGAKAKTSQLKKKYPGLFDKQDELSEEQNQIRFKLPNLVEPKQIDVQSILKALKIVSGEMITKQLLPKILNLIVEHCGAEKGYLIKKKDQEFIIEEVVSLNENQLVTVYEPTADPNLKSFSSQIVSYVFRQNEGVLLEDAYHSADFSKDRYIQENKTKSLLCIPFKLRKELYGVVYLENNLANRVFTEYNVEFVQTVLAQAAVAMENARLYEKTISTQKRLAKSEEKYKILVENTGAIVMHLSLGGVILFVNQSGARFFDSEPMELIGKSILETSQFFKSKYKFRARDLVQTGEGATYKDLVDLPAGEFWLVSNYQPVKDENESIVAVQITAQDITDYKEAEEELERLSMILEATSDFVCICNPDTSVQYINSAGKEMVGISAEANLVNLELKDFHPRWAMKIINSEGIPGAIDKSTWSGETALLLADGSEIPTSEVITAHRSDTGKLQYISTIARDITQHKESEKKLKVYQEQLEKLISKRTIELKEVQGQLIEKAAKAGVAEIAAGTLHNVANLLNSIKTSSNAIDAVVEHSAFSGFMKANDLLKANLNDLPTFFSPDNKGEKLIQYYLKVEESLQEESRSIKQELKRLNEKIDVISDVIAAQQSYAGVTSLTEPYSLITIVEDAVRLEAGLIDRYSISIVKKYQEIGPALIQKTKLIHVLVNLINNARDAMLQMPKDQRTLTFTIEEANNEAILKVTDTGKGINEEHLGKIFTHGFTTKKDGHGFGLHSSASFVDEMGGKIWVESEGEGKGATFMIQLPLADKVLPE